MRKALSETSSDKPDEDAISFMRVCIHCTNGYLFEEFYFPIIKQLKGYVITLVVDSYFLTDGLSEALESLRESGDISEIYFTPITNRFGPLRQHYELQSISNLLGQIDVLLIGLDNEYTTRYFIDSARRSKGSIISVSFSTNWSLLLNYGVDQDKSVRGGATSFLRRSPEKLLLNHNTFVILMKLLFFIKNRVRVFLRRRFKRFIHYHLCPFVVRGKSMEYSIFDEQRCPAGRADLYLFFDHLEEDAAKRLSLKTGLLSHPAGKFQVQAKAHLDTLVVLFNGCLTAELPEESLQIWIRKILEIRTYSPFYKVVLRPHPRTSGHLSWPLEICSRLVQAGLLSRLSYSSSESLGDVISDATGVLGAPSGALRWARALRNDIFIVGLANCMDKGPDDQAWVMGGVDYIRWSDSDTHVLPAYLLPVSDSKGPAREIQDVISKHPLQRC